LTSLNSETESLKLKVELRKDQEAALGDLTQIYLKQLEGNTIDADALFC